MTRSPLALVWAERLERGRKNHSVSLHQHLFGKSILRPAVETARRLRPFEVLVVLGADSVIMKDVPPETLAVARGRRIERPGRIRRRRKT